jgi:hypothetical protein
MRRWSNVVLNGVVTTRMLRLESASRNRRYEICGAAPTKAAPRKWTTASGGLMGG